MARGRGAVKQDSDPYGNTKRQPRTRLLRVTGLISGVVAPGTRVVVNAKLMTSAVDLESLNAAARLQFAAGDLDGAHATYTAAIAAHEAAGPGGDLAAFAANTAKYFANRGAVAGTTSRVGVQSEPPCVLCGICAVLWCAAVADCTAALTADPAHVKARIRHGTALFLSEKVRRCAHWP